jgi:tRNA threonylcarbamoyladenosine biosynthesis protein TsaE
MPLMSEPYLYTLANEQATQRLAGGLAAGLVDILPSPSLIYLHGNLGAGKTFFTRSFLAALGFTGRVKSPTFTLMEPYQLTYNGSQINIYHFDFYRFTAGTDWRDAGFVEYLPGDGIAIVEWPENATGLPTPDIDLHLSHGDTETLRFAQLYAHSISAKTVVNALQNTGDTP